MTPKERLFIAEYLVSLNAADAYRKAGYSSKGANVEARKTLAKPHIAAEIARLLKERYRRLEIDVDVLLKRAATILTADPRELSGHFVGACRYCYGQGHDFQWRTQREWIAACADAEVAGTPHPNCRGGFGYNITKRPDQECPECNGLGVPFVWFADTRYLSPAAQVLFEGVKLTKEGMEFMQASKTKAFELLARHHGLMKHRHEVTGKDGRAIEAIARARIIIMPPKVCPETTRHELPLT